MEHLKEFAEYKDEIQKYLDDMYHTEWWNEQLSERVFDYVSDEDLIGDDGDEENPEYVSYEEYYTDHCMGGAIEYDLLSEIQKDITKHFNMTDYEYIDNDILDKVENHMINNCDWYDKYLFGKISTDFNKDYNDLMNQMNNME